ncbi:uncharacterized protein [Haliotis cracherodii]|uniref:uncharacterized protein isoform X2 n=1 Tax=Haliotis cracherodii TaxID=6455 RepID=UPI0039E75D35
MYIHMASEPLLLVRRYVDTNRGSAATQALDHQILIPRETPQEDTIYLTGDYQSENGYQLYREDASLAEESLVDSCVDFEDDDQCAAPPLSDLYRYHVFFSHCPADVEWVEETVNKLQTPPYTYKTYYLCEKFNRRLSISQNLLCAVMLSERVVLVLSKKYVEETWPEFQEILKNLTATSLHKQRMLIVKLEDCEIPEILDVCGFLDATDPGFFQFFTRRLKSGRLPRSSESISSDIAAVLNPRANLVNGQVLASVQFEIRGYLQAHLMIDEKDEDIPAPLRCHGINLDQSEYWDMLQSISQVNQGSTQAPWVFTLQPAIVLLSAFGVWTLAFILVIVVFVDTNRADILSVRLTVFVFPLILISGVYIVRWKRRKHIKLLCKRMLSRCLHINSTLYMDDRPVVVTITQERGARFNVHFYYFNMTDCFDDVNLLLCSCLDEDVDKLSKLIKVYTKDCDYLSEMSLAERLTVMMAAPYALKLSRNLLPVPAQERHIDQQLCMCQFTEECMSLYIHCLSKENTAGLIKLFSQYLHALCTVRELREIQEMAPS